jgi:hypothetical protein
VEPDFEYTQARLQARLARLPEEGTWLRLAAVRGLPAYLEAARATVIGPWVGGLGAGSDADAIERTCRRLLLETVAEVARWVPEPWADAVRWTRWVMYLPEVEAWLRGGVSPRWEAESADLAVMLVVEEGTQGRRITGEGKVLLETFREERPLLVAWEEGWRARWPDCGEESRLALDSLARLVRTHGKGFPRLSTREAWPARRALRASLRHLFRRASQSPAAVFAYLLMLGLDLERLRADLMRRALFPRPEAA